MKKTLIIISSVLINYTFASDTNDDMTCRIWIKFEKNNGKYVVKEARNDEIDSGNVLPTSSYVGKITGLRYPYNPKPEKGIDQNIRMLKKPCSSDNTGIKISCEGDFVSKSDGATQAGVFIGNVLVQTLSLGQQPANKYEYYTKIDYDNVKLAENSDFRNDPIVEHLAQECNDLFIKNQQRIESENKSKQKKKEAEDTLILKDQQLKEQVQLAQAMKDQKAEILNEQKFKKQLTPGIETNCGTIVELKGIMALVQTGGDAGAVWFKKDYLAPILDLKGNIIICRDNNRIYKNQSGWILFK